MQKIYKYELKIQEVQTVTLPRFHHILSVANQDGKLYMWVAVEVEAPATRMVDRTIRIYGTGEPLSQEFLLDFIGTVLIDPFVWHVYLQAVKED